MSPPHSQASMLPYSFIFLIITTSHLVQLPRFGWAVDERFTSCGELACWDKAIKYPSIIAGPRDYCGRPIYELECPEDNQMAVATATSRKYQVLWENQNMTIVRMNLSDSKCPQEPGDFTLDKSLFSYTVGYSSATLFYNCSTQLHPSIYNFNCSMRDGFGSNPQTILPDDASRYTETCRSNISIPTLESSVLNFVHTSIDDNKVVRDGFKVMWVLDRKECNVTDGIFRCFCPEGAYKSTCPRPAPDRHAPPAKHQAPAPGAQSSRGIARLKLFMGTGIALGTITLSLATGIYCLRKRKSAYLKGHSKADQDIENFISDNMLLARRFTYAAIKRMTNSFSEKLGQGGFGSVYKGKLSDGTVVAVKLWDSTKGSGQEFINEVAGISRTSHVNIVTLLGFCFEGRKRAVIYEFMPNGSLDRFIHNENAKSDMRLGWEKLYQIAVGIARGLEYLHRGCNTRILHFDIKPHNILLDEEFHPKISDFGLSKLCLERESTVSMVVARGTIGYIAPEVFSRNFGRVSYKSDVYSYGMMLIEMIVGRNNLNVGSEQSNEIYFSDWVYRLVEQGYDWDLHGELLEEEVEMARKMALVGLWCIQTDPTQRPSMSRVIDMLEGTINSLQIPPKPFLSSPHRSPIDSSLSTPLSL